MEGSRFKGITMHVFRLENGQWGVSEDFHNQNPLIIEFDDYESALSFAKSQAEHYESEVLVHGIVEESV